MNKPKITFGAIKLNIASSKPSEESQEIPEESPGKYFNQLNQNFLNRLLIF